MMTSRKQKRPLQAGRIDCVMLAAGVSSRMEKWKLPLPCKGSTVIECSVLNALEVCSRVILVVGYRAGELETLFSDISSVEVVFNDQYKKDMFCSVKLGVSLVRTERFFIAMGDMPMVDPSVYRSLLQYQELPAVIPKYKGKSGHPLFLSRRVAECIIKSQENMTLRDVLFNFPTLAVPVECKHILSDIDNLEDYKRLM